MQLRFRLRFLQMESTSFAMSFYGKGFSENYSEEITYEIRNKLICILKFLKLHSHGRNSRTEYFEEENFCLFVSRAESKMDSAIATRVVGPGLYYTF